MDLAVLGDPLDYTLSPALHEAGLAALGIAGASRAIRTRAAELAGRLDTLEAEGLRGVNLTMPLKEAVLPLLERVSESAARARSVNTVVFDPVGRTGASTDGPGFLDLLAVEGLDPQAQRVVFLGAGGAARSVAAALAGAGARSVRAATRDPARHAGTFRALGLDPPLALDGAEVHAALAAATLVIQATPLRELEGPLDPALVPVEAVAIDMGYGAGPTPWVLALRARGVRARDGLGMLVHQARRSLALWTGRDVPLPTLWAAAHRGR